MVLENTLTQWGEIISEVAFLFYSIRFSDTHLFNFLTIAAYTYVYLVLVEHLCKLHGFQEVSILLMGVYFNEAYLFYFR